jgi:hypothetical protein
LTRWPKGQKALHTMVLTTVHLCNTLGDHATGKT